MYRLRCPTLPLLLHRQFHRAGESGPVARERRDGLREPREPRGMGSARCVPGLVPGLVSRPCPGGRRGSCVGPGSSAEGLAAVFACPGSGP